MKKSKPLSAIKRRLVSRGARCDLCPLRDKGVPVPPIIHPHPSLVIVGEGPGAFEEKLGKPFVGRTGKFLDQLLLGAGISRGSATIMNAALCRGETDDEKAQATKCCTPRLLRELQEAPSSTPIAVLGGEAMKAVLNLRSIILYRGFIWQAPVIEKKVLKAEQAKVGKHEVGSRKREEAKLAADTLALRSKLAGRTILPTLHPAFVLRSETWHPIIKVDFRRIGRVLRGDPIELADRGDLLVTADPKKAFRALKNSPVISLDVETTHAPSPLKAKLLCVGMGARVPKGLAVVLWPWKRKTMARALGRFLRSREAVVGHNMIGFDKVVLEKEGVR